MRPHSFSPKEAFLRLDSGRFLSISHRFFGWVVLVCAGLFALAIAPRVARAQQVSGSSSSQATAPDAPQPASAVDEERLPQTKRILGVIPNFKSVSTDEKLPRQTVKDKFIEATQDSFDYSSIILPGVIAAYSMATDAYPEFHQGAAGYARYYWHAAVDQTSENYMVEFMVPVLTREDTRYYTLGRGGFMKRTGYALSRAMMTRTDAGMRRSTSAKWWVQVRRRDCRACTIRRASEAFRMWRASGAWMWGSIRRRSWCGSSGRM